MDQNYGQIVLLNKSTHEVDSLLRYYKQTLNYFQTDLCHSAKIPVSFVPHSIHRLIKGTLMYILVQKVKCLVLCK